LDLAKNSAKVFLRITVEKAFDLVNSKKKRVFGLNTESSYMGFVGAEGIEAQYCTILEMERSLNGLEKRLEFLLKQSKN
jgi:hypothetical protein